MSASATQSGHNKRLQRSQKAKITLSINKYYSRRLYDKYAEKLKLMLKTSISRKRRLHHLLTASSTAVCCSRCNKSATTSFR